MRRAMASVVLGLLVAGCAGLLSLDDVGYASATDAGSDGALSDASAEGGAVDASRSDADASFDGEAGETFTYFDLTDHSKWTAVPIDILGGSASGQWNNAVFDGRYVHYGPVSANDAVLSYDTKATGFDKAASWQVVPVPNPDGSSGALLNGVAYAGGKLFLTPVGRAADPDLLFWRLPGSPSSTSWESLDVGAIEPISGFGYPGLDGRYLYLTPLEERASSKPTGHVVRIDPKALPSGAPTVFDLVGNLSTLAQGFNDAVFDGRFLYLLPNKNPNGASGVFARYDTQSAFSDAGAWDSYDLTNVSATLTKFGCGTFDGRYLYFFSDLIGLGPRAIMARYDTRAPFKDVSSWVFLDLVDPDAGTDGGAIDYFGGAAFDGRYVYAMANDGTAFQSLYLVRIDTTVPLDAKALQAVPLVDVLRLMTVPPQLTYTGFAFDGQYLYMVPFLGGIVARFEARTAGTPPPPSSVF